jgi:hypothetical protein
MRIAADADEKRQRIAITERLRITQMGRYRYIQRR